MYCCAETLVLAFKGDFVVFESPLAHKADAVRADSVKDEFGVVDAAEVLAEEGVFGPDFFQKRSVGDYFRRAGDAHLIVIGGEVAELDLRIGCDFSGFVVTAEIGDVNRESVGSHGGNGAEPWLGAFAGGELREFGVPHGSESEIRKLAGIDGFWCRHAEKEPRIGKKARKYDLAAFEQRGEKWL